MGLLYDLYRLAIKKKRCVVCGCALYFDSDADVCEMCEHEKTVGEAVR